MISNILEQGETLHEESIVMQYKDQKGDFDIIPEITEAECSVEMFLHFSGPLTGNPSLLKVLYLFFQRYNAAILICEDMYLLIWRAGKDFFKIFDPNGRDDKGCSSNDGKAALIITSPIEHLVHLILNMSSLTPSQNYVLYEIKLSNFGHLPAPIDKSEPVKTRKKLYMVVNKYFALIPSTTGIPSPLSKDETNSSLMVSYIALTYKDLDPPMHWTVNIVDNLIKYGTTRYRDFVYERQILKCTIAHLPRDLIFGNFRAFIRIEPFVCLGTISKSDSWKSSNLTTSFTDFFKDHAAGILEIDASSFAVWKDSNYYYVLDSFKRGSLGKANEDPNDPGNGYLQLHINLTSLCRVMCDNAKIFMTNGIFFFHSVKVESVTVFNANRQLLIGNNFNTLFITYPFPCPFPPLKYQNCEVPKSTESLPQLECLSILSEAPCERVCSESDFVALEKKAKRNQMMIEHLKKSQSIQSVEKTDDNEYFNSSDVIDSLLSLILCDVMTEISEKTKNQRPKREKSKDVKKDEEGKVDGVVEDGEKSHKEKGGRVSEDGKTSHKKEADGVSEDGKTSHKEKLLADKILVQTDEGYLKELQKRYRRGQIDDEDVCKGYQSYYIKDKVITLEEELKLDSNFIDLPDGSWIILSSNQIEVRQQNYESGILSAVIAIVVSSLYKISTWSAEVLDYIYSSAELLAEDFEPAKYIVRTLLERPLPKLKLGEQQYLIEVIKKTSGEINNFANTLSYELKLSDKVLVIFNAFACAIIKRYNFYYLFVGFPSDLVGFRSGNSSGYTCLTRFTDIDVMLKRIDFGRINAADADSFLLCHIGITDITADSLTFVERTESNEELEIKLELENQKEYKKLREERLKLISKEIEREKKRVENFKREKERVEDQRKKRSERKSKYIKLIFIFFTT